ncbi:MAG: PAS domain-containing protein [Vicinamibacteria bacterium]|nr:PAS domain-containing protein [Vicinamibacteria bacterium]
MPDPPARLRILHLEDDPRDAALMADRLEAGGVIADVRVTRDRAGFESELEAGEWDLILCDYNVPGYDGGSALRLARAKRPLAPVIMLSGSISPEEAVECMREGATDYILKQRPERLASAVLRAIREVEEHRRRLAAEALVLEKQERLRLAITAAGMEAWDVDLRTGRVRKAEGPPDADAQDESLDPVHPEDRERRQAAFAALVRDGTPYQIEYRLLRPGGAVTWVAAWGTLLRDEAGEPTRVIGVSQEITERKNAQVATLASLHQKELLLKEVHHRVKNNLQVISSLLRLEAHRINDPLTAGALRGMTGRVRSMALLHETLYRSQNFDEVQLDDYLARIAHSVLRSVSPRHAGVEFVRDTESLAVGIDQAMPCGLIVNELVSNSLKHGFPDGASGRIRLEVRRGEGKEVVVRVSDTGVGLSEAPPAAEPSMGLQLVNDLVRQLRGRIVVSSGPGASYELFFERVPMREWMRSSGPP